MLFPALIFVILSYFLLWLCFPASHDDLFFLNQEKSRTEPIKETTVGERLSPVLQSYPLRNDGVFFISHASSGPARELALTLSKYGFQVLVGVKNKVEKRSFLYSMKKGIELIEFNLEDPTTYPTLIYRLRYIRRDLDRPLVGVVLNLADEIQLASNLQSNDILDPQYLEERYKAIFKSPSRVLTALLELNKVQCAEHVKQRTILEKQEIALPLTPSSLSSTDANNSKTSFSYNAEGFRIILLTKETPPLVTSSFQREQSTM
jgi:hypothetical protein